MSSVKKTRGACEERRLEESEGKNEGAAALRTN